LRQIITDWSNEQISTEDVKSIIVRLIDENWPECPIKEVRLSHVLHAVLVQASALMDKEPPESSLAAKKRFNEETFCDENPRGTAPGAN
jgi:3-mercaptopyruvate sulfurtransferase SseA